MKYISLIFSIIFIFVLPLYADQFIDNFTDGDYNCSVGTWVIHNYGDTGDAITTSSFVTGITDNAIRLTYEGDSGSWTANILQMEFYSAPVDLTSYPISNISFWAKSPNSGRVRFMLENPFVEGSNGNANYVYDLEIIPTTWTYYQISLYDNLAWNGGSSGVYPLEDAIKNCKALKWENFLTGVDADVDFDNVWLYTANDGTPTPIYTNELKTDESVEIHNTILDFSAGENVSRIFYTNYTGTSPTISIYDVFGNLIKELTIVELTDYDGVYADWDGTNQDNKDAATGLYLVVCRSEQEQIIKKIVLIR